MQFRESRNADYDELAADAHAAMKAARSAAAVAELAASHARLVRRLDEIRRMQEWLRSRGAPLPDPHAHHAPGAALMPGMLTPAEMAQLAAASGPEFDKLFLELMIKHHEGALIMVRQLFASPGAAQDSDIFAFASDVDADQRMEIQRMAAMLKELQ